jgi:rhodanese-related sulfurtransferase
MANPITPAEIRQRLLARIETAFFDLREEAVFATGHPLFASQLPPQRIALEIAGRVPRKDCCIIVYDDGEGLTGGAIETLERLGYSDVRLLTGGLGAWRAAGYELFEDVNSYSKAFGELVEHRRHTPSLSAEEVQALIDEGADIAILDARRFDEYATMSIPTGRSAPGAELVVRAPAAAPDPQTLVIVNCAGRTRSIIGAQSLINFGLPNKVHALRNGTIGWTLARQKLAMGQSRVAPQVDQESLDAARARAREVAYRAGVRRVTPAEARALAVPDRILYCFDVRQPEPYAAGHIPGFRNAPGGQLVQETDMVAPVRGARILLADDLGPRADMTASWLAQMGWEVYVLDGGFDDPLETGAGDAPPPRGPEGRYKRPYEGTDNPVAAMQAYLDWEYGLVDQLARDGTHGFFVI